jgi:protein O-GlcNAc transferase
MTSTAASPPATATLSLEAAMELAHSHHAAGRLEQAERVYRNILQAYPNHPFALLHLGIMALQVGRYDYAAARFKSMLSKVPGNVAALVGLSNALSHMGDLSGAEGFARQALQVDASNAAAHSSLGRILLDRAMHAQATASHARAYELEPDNPLHLTGLLHCMALDEAVDAQELARLHREFGKRFGAGMHANAMPHTNARDPGKRLRIGFVSGDLRHHAVAFFIEPVWREFDRTQVELFAYSNSRSEDSMSGRLKGLVEHWRAVIALNDEQLAQQVRDDGIDILIDLSGHTVGNRLLAFARKPAPLQASWIGYPETTGLAAMDYYLADPHSAPPGPIDELYVEKIVRLPASVAFQPEATAPDVNPLPALQRGYVTFGSFNRLSKLGASVLSTWSAILRALPDSRLLLVSVTDAAQADELRQRFAAQGVSADRLSFAPRMALAKYLAMHHEIDVLLDTFPYTGGTTTQHALWMGVPVITLAGLRRSERISTANLTRVGLQDWSVDSTEAYVARAVAAANDLQGLAALRAGLRERTAASPLRQASTVARSLEVAFRSMWQRWCEGLPPEPLEVSLAQAMQGTRS